MKQFIKNRNNQNISVVTEMAKNPKGLVFVMHGLGDSKDSDHIKTFSQCFLDNDYNVVRFDVRNTFGESEGKFEDANITNYYEDLEDVINWSKSQDFYQEPFILCGHSLGAICSAFYAENYPEQVKALAPFSTPVNADLSKKNYTKEELVNWEKNGFIVEDWGDFEVKIKWSYMKEKEKYDLLKKVEKLKMPVLLIVGELDDTTLPENQQILFTALPGEKELHIVKSAPHTFRDKNHLGEVYSILSRWVEKIN